MEPPAVYDARIDDSSLARNPTPQMLAHVQQQALMRSCQGQFVLLPDDATGPVLARMQRFYDAAALQRLDNHRAGLEAALIGPLVAQVKSTARNQTCAA